MRILSASFSLVLVLGTVLAAAETEIGRHRFTVPDGFEIELVAGPDLVPRPINADFDEQGYLYVTDSSGSNDPVQVQLEQKPHRVLRLADTDGDGRFDESIVFADRLMFPEGVLWHEGSLYIAAPPAIIKLTDTDGDGVADEREEWFNGQTLTGCANDLHGPYRGPDGWIYWCKGAFAEQTYERPGKPPLVTKASHIFRRDPRSGHIESVMTGGMDNPVEVIFTPGGERIFTTTFFQFPSGGQRDGTIHAVYGGVYGKNHAVLDGHPRTGDLLPPLTHLGAAAPSGLAILESDQLGADYQHNVLASCFNMHKVTRHTLHKTGASFTTTDETFVLSDNIDFHPTDVLEDADGSVLVVDTGGWYKLCCPTSHLHKPDVLGGIYRVRRVDAPRVDDPRGLKVKWNELGVEQLAELLSDTRPAVRNRAVTELARHGEKAVGPCAKVLQANSNEHARRSAVWALTRIEGAAARKAVHAALSDSADDVRQAALHSISLWRDAGAFDLLLDVVQNGTPHNRRAAAEALGRLEDARAIPALLAAAVSPEDRMLEHSIIYALIEIDDAAATREELAGTTEAARRSALIALDQMPSGNIMPTDVVPLLESPDPLLRQTAVWIVDRHPEWAEALVDYLDGQLRTGELAAERIAELEQQLARFGAQPAFQQFLATALLDNALPTDARRIVLAAMARADIRALPDAWANGVAQLLRDESGELRDELVATATAWRAIEKRPAALHDALLSVAADARVAEATRLEALAASRHTGRLNDSLFEFALSQLAPEQPTSARLTAAESLVAAELTTGQLSQLTSILEGLGPMELGRILPAFAKSTDEKLGLQLVAALTDAPSISGVPVATLRVNLEKYGEAVQREAQRLYASLEVDADAQREYFDELLASLGEGDIRRGQQVFYGSKAACSTCHEIGYLGGDIGPDLTQIGRIRSRRDLLEAIVFPSASFVRSYEPVTVVTVDGQVYNGVLRQDAAHEIVLAVAADKIVSIPREDIEEMLPGKVSVMPAGLDKQLTKQELADLLEFLQNSK